MNIKRMGVVAAGVGVFLAMAWMIFSGAPTADACTTAVVGPEASTTGTPILWKNRDTSVLSNKVVFVDEEPHAYLCLANARADSGRSCFAGLNDAGFAIINTVAYNVPGLAGESKDHEGIIQADALRTCRTVDDFQRYLEANLGPELGPQTNIGVFDADGGAALFEVHNHGFERIDVADQPSDYLVNTNFARSGEGGEGEGYIRFERASDLFRSFPPGGVDPEVILHSFSRDIRHPFLDNADGTGYLPGLLKMESSIFADTAAFLAGRPGPQELGDYQDRVADRVLGHLQSVVIEDAEPPPTPLERSGGSALTSYVALREYAHQLAARRKRRECDSAPPTSTTAARAWGFTTRCRSSSKARGGTTTRLISGGARKLRSWRCGRSWTPLPPTRS